MLIEPQEALTRAVELGKAVAERLGPPTTKTLAVTIRRPAEEVSARWQQEAGVDVREVRFATAPGDRGTEVRVVVHGNAIERSEVLTEMRRFKQRLESGNTPRSDGSPEGADPKRFAKQRPAQPKEAKS